MPTSDTPAVKRVPVKSAWLSKINWGEAAKVVAMGATFFGVPQEIQTQALAVIIGIGAIYTWVVRTWFTKDVTPSSLP